MVGLNAVANPRQGVRPLKRQLHARTLRKGPVHLVVCLLLFFAQLCAHIIYRIIKGSILHKRAVGVSLFDGVGIGAISLISAGSIIFASSAFIDIGATTVGRRITPAPPRRLILRRRVKRPEARGKRERDIEDAQRHEQRKYHEA